MPVKKHLGQHFLKSGVARAAVFDVADPHADDLVLEIGPGKGALTSGLVKLAGKVIAVEKDPDMIALLKEKFAKDIERGTLELFQNDILDFEIADGQRLTAEGYKVVGNIPYNITGAIIKKFLSSDTQPSSMTLLVQREVADRIVARDGKESMLSLSVKAYGTPKLVKKVPKSQFAPAPKVDSAIIHIADITKDHFDNKQHEKNFFTLVKAGFAHKRKILKKNLEEILEKDTLTRVFSALDLAEKTRAEDIPFPQWLDLAREL